MTTGKPHILLDTEETDCPDNWEALLLDHIPALERNLIEHAYRLQAVAVDLLSRHRQADGDAVAVNLGVVVRVREDTLGPRIHWVRFRGKSRYRNGGDRFTPTEPIRMQGRFRYSARIFAAFPAQTRQTLVEIEEGCAWIRYRTDRLAALRDLCRKTASSAY